MWDLQPPCKEEWYVGSCSRVDAEHALHLVNTVPDSLQTLGESSGITKNVSKPLCLYQDGAFLVRNCSLNTSSEPLVLAIYYEKRVYNIKIRFVEECNKYTLGTGLRSNDVSVQ